MEITENRISLDSYLEISAGNICKRIGYTADAQVSPRIESLIEEYMGKARDLIEPVYTYAMQNIQQVKGTSVQIDKSITLDSQVISQVLSPCNNVAVFALTIGDKLEKMTAELGEQGLILEAFILDSIGSSFTEKTAEVVNGIISEMANIQNQSVSRRFSPGYCDWHISQQKMLFKILDRNVPGITLSDDYMMTPEKSITGIIGIGPSDSEVATFNPCAICTKHSCLWRRA